MSSLASGVELITYYRDSKTPGSVCLELATPPDSRYFL